MSATSTQVEVLFDEVCSVDFLKFSFGGRGYQDQLYDAIAKTETLAGVKVECLTFSNRSPTSVNNKVVWVTHNFGFLGGSLGCAEGEKITRAFEYGLEHKLPVVVQCRSGGARMQEGTSSLMQMAKVAVAVEALHQAKLPFIAVLNDPTYGGVSASYAMQADIRIAMSDARIGFAGPAVILNTMCEADQTKFDNQCPADFQCAQYVLDHGQIDMVFEISPTAQETQSRVESLVHQITSTLLSVRATPSKDSASSLTADDATAEDREAAFNYTRSRAMDRPQSQDIIKELFEDFVELSGDGRVGRDVCIRGGLASFSGQACVVLGTFKGHGPQAMLEANYGMASPHGYRTAMRLMQMAERFGLPVVTLVDTVGAWPTFECERDGQSEAIATNLTVMAGLKVPIVTIMIGEGGSGGALGIGMGNIIGMLSGGYFGVISPEGAASILGRYKDDADKAVQFPLDCQALATAQCIYAYQLEKMGVVDEIIWEQAETEAKSKETFQSFPVLKARLHSFLQRSLAQLSSLSEAELISHRYTKYRALGTYSEIPEAEKRLALIQDAHSKKGEAKRPPRVDLTPSLLVKHLAEEIVTGTYSKYRGLAPALCPANPPVPPTFTPKPKADGWTNAKKVLDAEGPDALAKWVIAQKKVLLTDTTMRDAHQSLLATRVRNLDLVEGGKIANEVLRDAFSFEAWGGATFDVCMRFLDECPWDRLRALRAACPDVCLQMLIRGSNAVGYTSYPDNVVSEFIRLAALNGMDVFRIFDCFNDIDSMDVSIKAVIAAGKVAEVCLCYTGDVLTSKIYDLAYYQSVAVQAVKAGAHMIGIKDMSGLLRPLEAGPLLAAIRAVAPGVPVHFHTHSTSSVSLATCFEMARNNCDIIDFCTASMADGTSQPSLNAFVAMMQGASNDTGINYLDLESYDVYWARCRDMYEPFESGMKSGSARVFEHQVPGGQYSNLLVQCKSMGIQAKWEEVLDAYRDVNKLFGDIIKVTPSSKCVGDLALYLVTRSLTTADLLDPSKASSIDFPESVVGLLKGDLGFPHKGFPQNVEDAILKGTPRRTVRAGLALVPADFTAHLEGLGKRWGRTISPEEGMSSLMYPQVFTDFMTRREQKGLLLKRLPTPVYLYGLLPGESFTMSSVPASEVKDALVSCAGASADVCITLKRIGPLKGGNMRSILFTVNGKDQQHEVKDSSGKFEFEGPMADSKKAGQIGSPMPGSVEKLLVAEGQLVAAGETLCTISAMKMEVKVTSPFEGKVVGLNVAAGTRVVEGALLLTLASA